MPTLITSTGHRLHRFADQEWWAERGLINIVNRHTGEHRVETVREFRKRTEALHLQSRREKHADARAELRRVVSEMVDVIAEALDQGDPHQPGVMQQVAHENRYISAIVPALPASKLILPPGV